MEGSRRRRFSVFTLVFVLIGISGINISGAATAKYTLPSAPTDVTAVGGLNSATLKWKAPSTNGGQKITSYKVTYHPGKKVYVCKSSATTCKVPIANPNKPSSKPVPVWFYFTVAAVNSVGTGPESIVGYARVLVRFRASITIPWSVPNAKPTPVPTPMPTTFPQRPGITAFDGKYQGTAIVTVTQNENVISLLSSTLNTSNTVLNGDITGTADIWKINGYVTDVSGVATVTASNSMYGAMTFTVTFVSDPVTHAVKGTGKGTNTVEYPGIGTVKVVFDFSISSATS
ncbi:MAG: fibronectin type III domain-containing protein [Candidatus Nanopelagicaceae bacterium]|nr:fibronectin type III domain-containing protein [Candidatus Nanopelagicaceae bacterium]